MAVPDYQSLLMPLLRLAATKKADTIAKAQDLLAKEFSLSQADREARLPSGKQTVLSNRTGWASFYLVKAGLLVKPKHGVFHITPKGSQFSAGPVRQISLQDLLEIEEFKNFYLKQPKQRSSPAEDSTAESGQTPDEILQEAYETLRSDLADEILERLLKVSPDYFESVVVELLVAMGYGGSRKDAGERVGKSGDGGIDGIIKEDKLGLDTIYIQAKRWQGSVGRPEIQKFVGALQGLRAKKGVFMTTSIFSPDAITYASLVETKVVLLDGMRIAQLMIENDVGVSPVSTFVVKKIDSDYFDEA